METDIQITLPAREAVEAAENVYHKIQILYHKAIADFELKWAAFQQACNSLPTSARYSHLPILSVLYIRATPRFSLDECTRTLEFEILKKQGPKILAFVVFKLATDTDKQSVNGVFLCKYHSRFVLLYTTACIYLLLSIANISSVNALAYDPKYRRNPFHPLVHKEALQRHNSQIAGLGYKYNHISSNDPFISKEALQRYRGQIVELGYQHNKVYDEYVRLWREHCESVRLTLSRAECCDCDEYEELREVGPVFIPHLMVKYSHARWGYWYELLHEIVHGRGMGAHAIFDRPNLIHFWADWLNGGEYEEAPLYTPTELDIRLKNGMSYEMEN